MLEIGANAPIFLIAEMDAMLKQKLRIRSLIIAAVVISFISPFSFADGPYVGLNLAVNRTSYN